MTPSVLLVSEGLDNSQFPLCGQQGRMICRLMGLEVSNKHGDLALPSEYLELFERVGLYPDLAPDNKGLDKHYAEKLVPKFMDYSLIVLFGRRVQRAIIHGDSPPWFHYINDDSRQYLIFPNPTPSNRMLRDDMCKAVAEKTMRDVLAYARAIQLDREISARNRNLSFDHITGVE